MHNMINFQQRKAQSLEIYQIAAAATPWNIFPMANPDKKAEAERRARDTYQRLMVLKESVKPEMSNNEWTKKAGVSTSFFTNMQGNTKPASEPTVGNLRAVLAVMGVSLPEFFLAEAKGRLAPVPTQQVLERALADAWAGKMPRTQAGRISYLASVVRQLLQLPAPLPTTAGANDDSEAVVPGEAAPTRRATKRAGR